MPEVSAGILVCDLDGTLLRVNSFPHFVKFLAVQALREGRLRRLAGLLGGLAGRRLGIITHGELKARVCTWGSEVPASRLRDWAETLVQNHNIPATVALVQAWRGEVVITTAAPEVYAVHLGVALGVPVVQGTVIRDGQLLNNESHQKGARLREIGVRRVDVFVTDDVLLDGPVAALADTVMLVTQSGTLVPWTALAGTLDGDLSQERPAEG